MKLTLERKDQPDTTLKVNTPGGTVMATPEIDEDYWTFRVKVNYHQAVVGFPKFMTIGIGFAEEQDWNTNLPFECDTDEILNHIWHNAGRGVTRARTRRAIEMIQEAAQEGAWRA